jgi:hypothetical protein
MRPGSQPRTHFGKLPEARARPGFEVRHLYWSYPECSKWIHICVSICCDVTSLSLSWLKGCDWLGNQMPALLDEQFYSIRKITII